MSNTWLDVTTGLEWFTAHHDDPDEWDRKRWDKRQEYVDRVNTEFSADGPFRLATGREIASLFDYLCCDPAWRPGIPFTIDRITLWADNACAGVDKQEAAWAMDVRTGQPYRSTGTNPRHLMLVKDV